MRRNISAVIILCACIAIALVGCRYPLCPAGEDPHVIITKPTAPASGSIQALPTVIAFEWKGGNEQEPRAVRRLLSLVVDTNGVYNPMFDIVRDLNANPSRYESKWSKWIPYNNPNGKGTIIGDDEILEVSRSHIFAVQAMDFCGKTTKIFDRRINIRQFIVSRSARPLLRVSEPFLGGAVFLGTSTNPRRFDFPPGVALNFRWRGDASSYGGEIKSYRYGWDVADINNPRDWEVSPSLTCVSAPPKVLNSGVHTLYVEAVDLAGVNTIARIEINIIPFTMERNLLWVDDFPSSNFTQYDYAFPTESEHDQFWLGHCGKATGFAADRDVYDARYSYNTIPPPMTLIGQYKNVIWSYSSSPDDGAWDDLIRFTPESMIGQGTELVSNYLPIFLAKGGHLLTEGNSDRSGGLAAALYPQAQRFPMSLKCEITGNQAGCVGDSSGVYSMPYKDYCVTMIDKIVGAFRTDPDMPMRRVRNYDAMTYALKAADAATDAVPGLPARLDLWEEVVKPGRYFDPNAPSPLPGGFTMVEIYDPAYWMQRAFVQSQACFHPMYRMKSKNSLSALNDQAVALCLTKYATVVPTVMGGPAVAAKSFHFGFELWYFNRVQVDQTINVILTEWQIKAN